MSNITVQILGSKLSQEIGKSMLICSGILYLALRDVNLDSNILSLDQWIYVIESALPKRLAFINILDIDKIIQKLKVYLIENQSLFTFAI
jgi:hypothetical protein